MPASACRGALRGVLLGICGSLVVPLSLRGAPPARLRPTALPPEAPVDSAAMARLLTKGRLEEAQLRGAAWQFRHPRKPPPLPVALVAALYRRTLSGTSVQAGPLTLIMPPEAPSPSKEMLAELETGYRAMSSQLYDGPPPPARIHLVDALPGGLHGAHLAGHMVAERSGMPAVVFHELGHYLVGLHPGARGVGRLGAWMNEGLVELLVPGGDLRLRSSVPRCADLPDRPEALFGGDFPSYQAYLPVARAVRLWTGGASPFRLGVRGLLSQFASVPDPALLEPPGFAESWRKVVRQEACLPDARAFAHGALADRFSYLDAEGQGDLPGAASVLARAASEYPQELPGWMTLDALSLASALAKAKAPPEAQRILAEAVPWAGLIVPGGFTHPAWKPVLRDLLAADPPPKALLFLTIMLWETPWRDAISKAWMKGFSVHGENTEWLLCEAMRTAYLGRLQPPPGDPYAAVSARIERLVSKLHGRTDQDPELAEAVAEARAAYAFGSGDFELAESAIRGEMQRQGWRPRLALNLAACQARQGAWEKALETYQRGLMVAPASPDLRLGFAVAALAREQTDAAAAAAAALAGVEDRGDAGPRILQTRARLARIAGNETAAVTLEKEAAARGYDPEGSPVPAEFQVNVHTKLERLVAELEKLRPRGP